MHIILITFSIFFKHDVTNYLCPQVRAVVSITLMSEGSTSLGSDHLNVCIRRSTIILTHIHVFSFWKEKSAFIQIKAPPVAVIV